MMLNFVYKISLAAIVILIHCSRANCHLPNEVLATENVNVFQRIQQNSCDRTPVPTITPTLVRKEQLQLNITPIHELPNVLNSKTATLGMGCFWGAESLYGGTAGVISTTVGYAGGNKESPTYRDLGDHTEVLQIVYDSNVVSFEGLLKLFWNNHEYGLTTPIKTQYISLILYHDLEQKQIAERSFAEEQKRRLPEVVTTKIEQFRKFYAAEDYHQKYRLQVHRQLCETLNLTPKLLQTSYIATKLNGYMVGVGGLRAFLSEVDNMGLTPSQKKYCSYFIEKNKDRGLYC